MSGGLHLAEYCDDRMPASPYITPMSHVIPVSKKLRNGWICWMRYRLKMFCTVALTLCPTADGLSFWYLMIISSPTVMHCPDRASEALARDEDLILMVKPVGSRRASTPLT